VEVPVKHTVHVHQQKIRRGEPAIIDRTYRGSVHQTELAVDCPSCGHEAGRFVQLPVPDQCGARVVFRTTRTRRVDA
jgi:predicted RNA-binding Zn-ribbon protein involved in translation (DUF1610 family)